MKKLAVILLLVFTSGLNAQIINFPDLMLKAAISYPNAAKGSNGLSINVDANYDGNIQVSEALMVYQLNIADRGITSAEGLQYFTNLRTLYMNDNNLSGTLDVSMLTNLRSFHCSYNYNLTAINVTGLTVLEALHCGGTNIATLDVSTNENLYNLGFGFCPATHLDVSGLTKLEILGLNNSQLTSLNVSGCSRLKKIVSNYSHLTSLDVSDCPILAEVSVEGNELTTLDFSNNPLITSLWFDSNPLQTLYIKNGGLLDFSSGMVSFATTPTLQYICADEAQISSVNQTLASKGYTNVTVDSFCSYSPGTATNQITGQLTYDTNGNGCGSGDILPQFLKVHITGNNTTGITFTDNAGKYRFYTGAGNFTITPASVNPHFLFTPTTATSTFVTVNNTIATHDFCIQANGSYSDVEAIIVPIGNAMPGFNADYKIIYKNNGNQILNGQVTLAYQESLLDLVSTTPVANSIANGQLTWTYQDLLPLESREIAVRLNVNTPTEQPAVNAGDNLIFNLSVTPLADDLPNNNSYTYTQEVVGSFDPNNIICLEGEHVDPVKIGDYLHYIINFENTGNAAATFVVIKDDIDSAKFNISSFDILATSHPVQVWITNGKVEFRFDAINLAPAGKGYVVFRIKSSNTLQEGNEVANNANIFFDYNYPVATNIATTAFDAQLNVNLQEKESMSVYPNPVEDFVTIEAAGDIESVSLTDLQGRVVQLEKPSGKSFSLEMAGRVSGIYILTIKTECCLETKKIVKK